MAIVYWIHLDSHTDIKTEGYVGYSTRDLPTRFNEHLREAKVKGRRKTVLHKAVNKYGETRLISEVLLEGSPEYCLLIEEKLRPSDKIGWNIVRGGGVPPSHAGAKHSEDRKKKASERLKGKIPLNFEVMMTKALEARSKVGTWQRTSSKSQKEVWSKADLIYQYLNGVSGRQNFQELAAFLGITNVESVRKVASDIKKRGFNPLVCPNWLRDFNVNHESVQELISSHVDPSFGKTQDVLTRELRAKSLRYAAYSKSKHWLFASTIFEKMKAGERRCDITSELGFTKNNLTEMYRRFNKGWNPNEDQEYLSWLSEKQKDKNDNTSQLI